MLNSKRLMVYCIFVLITSALHAQISATLVDFSGEVMISRNGEFLPDYEIDYGTELFSYDILQTGRDGYAEIIVESPVSAEISIKVTEESTLNLEHRINNGNEETSLNLYRGAVQTRAATLLKGGKFNIRTQSTTMGVRGTTFTVSTTPDTSLLVTCREGKVVCSTSGSDSLIQPGKVFESVQGKEIRTIDVSAGEIDNYTKEWKDNKMEALLMNGALSIEYYSRLYLKTTPGFLDAYKEIIKQKDIFEKWEDIISRGDELAMSEAVKDKMDVSKGIITLRSSLPMMRHVYFTYYDLISFMDRTDSNWSLSGNAAKSVRLFRENQSDYLNMITLAQYYFKLYLEMDRQSSPFSNSGSESLLDDFLMNSDF